MTRKLAGRGGLAIQTTESAERLALEQSKFIALLDLN